MHAVVTLSHSLHLLLTRPLDFNVHSNLHWSLGYLLVQVLGGLKLIILKLVILLLLNYTAWLRSEILLQCFLSTSACKVLFLAIIQIVCGQYWIVSCCALHLKLIVSLYYTFFCFICTFQHRCPLLLTDPATLDLIAASCDDWFGGRVSWIQCACKYLVVTVCHCIRHLHLLELALETIYPYKLITRSRHATLDRRGR